MAITDLGTIIVHTNEELLIQYNPLTTKVVETKVEEGNTWVRYSPIDEPVLVAEPAEEVQ